MKYLYLTVCLFCVGNCFAQSQNKMDLEPHHQRPSQIPHGQSEVAPRGASPHVNSQEQAIHQWHYVVPSRPGGNPNSGLYQTVKPQRIINGGTPVAKEQHRRHPIREGNETGITQKNLVVPEIDYDLVPYVNYPIDNLYEDTNENPSYNVNEDDNTIYSYYDDEGNLIHYYYDDNGNLVYSDEFGNVTVPTEDEN